MANATGNRMPFTGNRDFRQGAFYAARASAHLVGNPRSGVSRIFADALLANARADAGLDTSGLTRRGAPFTFSTGQF